MKRARDTPAKGPKPEAKEPPKKKQKGPKKNKKQDQVLARYKSAIEAGQVAPSSLASSSSGAVVAPTETTNVKTTPGRAPKAQRKQELKLFRSDKGGDMLHWLLYPKTPKEFFDAYWGRKALHVERGQLDYYQLETLFSKASLKKEMRKNRAVLNDENFTMCRIVDNKRQFQKINDNDLLVGPSPTYSSADKMIWDLYAKGYTLQVFQPQRWSPQLARLVQLLESTFGTLIGCNAYLTPPSAQGLAPHWDDVDVFILQLEGKKNWNLYFLPDEQALPREYSKDLDVNDLGEPDLKITLNPGDVLYFPRGVIHYATTDSDQPSHHLTVSTYQRHTWYDFMMAAVPNALKTALSSSVDFRQGLPVNFSNYMGSSFHFSVPDDDDDEEEEGGKQESKKKTTGKEISDMISIQNAEADRKTLRRAFIAQFKDLFDKLPDFMDLDSSVDQYVEDFQSSRMAPSTPSLSFLLTNPGPRPTSEQDLISLIDLSFIRMSIGPFIAVEEDGNNSDPEESDPDRSDEDSDTPTTLSKPAGKHVFFGDDDEDASEDDKMKKKKKKKEKKEEKPKIEKKKKKEDQIKRAKEVDPEKLPYLEEEHDLMVAQSFCVKLAHAFENEKSFHMKMSTPLEEIFLPLQTAPVISSLFVSHPSFVSIADLALGGFSLAHAQLLFDFNFIQTKPSK